MITKLKNVVLSFPNLFKAQVFEQGEPAYSAIFILDKTDPQVAEIEKLIKAVASDKWGAKADPILKSIIASNKSCLRDGADKAQYAGFAGKVYISARSTDRPTVIDRDRASLMPDANKCHAGDVVNCSLDVWAMDNKFGKRICASLRGVQFVKQGECFSGSAPAKADEFDDVSDVGNDENDLL